MSLHDYDLVCQDCRVSLGLGCPVNDTDDCRPDQWSSTAIDEIHMGMEVYSRVITKFLIVHRNHRLIYMPSEAVGLLEQLVGHWYKPQSPEEVLAQPLDPPFLPRQETAEWEKRKEAAKKNR